MLHVLLLVEDEGDALLTDFKLVVVEVAGGLREAKLLGRVFDGRNIKSGDLVADEAFDFGCAGVTLGAAVGAFSTEDVLALEFDGGFGVLDAETAEVIHLRLYL